MNIEEYADALNLELEIRRYPNQCNRYAASFENCETKASADDGCLTGTYGNGDSPSGAVVDYVQQIRGKILVHQAYSGDKRREYVVPKNLKAF